MSHYCVRYRFFNGVLFGHCCVRLMGRLTWLRTSLLRLRVRCYVGAHPRYEGGRTSDFGCCCVLYCPYGGLGCHHCTGLSRSCVGGDRDVLLGHEGECPGH